MRRLLIVDDEIDTLMGLAECMDWASLGIDEVYTATNGEVGLKKAKEIHPHIILSDIAMPRMDGVEFAREVSKELPNVRIVFVTGYWEEEYLKAAFKSKVVNYILKPIDPQELRDTVEGILRDMEGEEEREKTFRAYEARAKESLPLIKEKLLISLIRGRVSSQRHLRQQFALIEASHVMEGHNWAAVSIRVNSCPWFEEGDEVNLGLLEVVVADVFREISSSLGLYGSSFHDRDRDFACVVAKSSAGDEEGLLALEEIMDEFCTNMYKALGERLQILCTIGVGEWVNSPLLLHFSWQEAEKCLMQSFSDTQTPIIWASRLHNTMPIAALELRMKIRDVRQLVQKGNCNMALEEIDKAFQELRGVSCGNIAYCKAMCLQLYNSIGDVMMESANPSQEDLAEITGRVEKITSAGNLAEIQKIIRELCCFICEKIEINQKRENETIAEVKRILNKSYWEDISINALAEQVYISPSYLCLLFKQETGSTIKEYLTKIRIEKAADLLDQTDRKVIDICYDVGYRDTKYFSRLFRKQIGTSPAEYRKGQRT